MTLSAQISAYEDCLALFERALNDKLGARACLGTRDRARIFVMRMHQARQLERDEAKKQFPKDDPRWGKSEFDVLRVTMREDTENDWWVYLDRPGAEILAIDSLSELEP